jgi:hypothetical protein
MARFVFASSGFDNAVTLQAINGEELTLEEVQAWASVRSATALDEIARQLSLIASRIGENSNCPTTSG